MTAIGETLRRERLKRNLQLGQISEELKISSRMLAAIEDEKFDRLPGGVFARSFVRQYARYLGLDEDAIAQRVEPLLDPVPDIPHYPEAAVQANGPIQVPPVDDWETVGGRQFSWKSPLTALGLVLIAMLGCAGVYAWWSHARRAPSTPEASVPSIDSVHAANPPAKQVPVSESKPVQVKPEAAPLQPASLPQPAVDANAPVRVQLTAAEPVWISVKSDGKVVFVGLLEANQSRTIAGNAAVVVLLGNAGGVNIELNGKPVAPVGPKGQVRTVQFTSGGFEIVAPKPAPAAPDPM